MSIPSASQIYTGSPDKRGAGLYRSKYGTKCDGLLVEARGAGPASAGHQPTLAVDGPPAVKGRLAADRPRSLRIQQLTVTYGLYLPLAVPVMAHTSDIPSILLSKNCTK